MHSQFKVGDEVEIVGAGGRILGTGIIEGRRDLYWLVSRSTGGAELLDDNEIRKARGRKRAAAPRRPRRSDLLRDMEHPTVFGYELDRQTLTPIRRYIGQPTGDVVDAAEADRRVRERLHRR